MKKYLEFHFKNNHYFVKVNTSDKAVIYEISKTFIRLFKSGNFNLNWLKTKVIEIHIKK